MRIWDCGINKKKGEWVIVKGRWGVKSLSLNSFERDELHYTLDPKDVYGPDFPGETFRVLKEKEEKQYGEYRTRRLVSEAWDNMELMHKSNGARWDCWEGWISPAPKIESSIYDVKMHCIFTKLM